MRTKGRRHSAFPHVRRVSGRGERIVLRCARAERARAGTSSRSRLATASAACRRCPRARRASVGAQPASPSASRPKPTNTMKSSSRFCPSRRRVEAAGTPASPGSAHRQSRMEGVEPIDRLRRRVTTGAWRRERRCTCIRTGPVDGGRSAARSVGSGSGDLGNARQEAHRPCPHRALKSASVPRPPPIASRTRALRIAG